MEKLLLPNLDSNNTTVFIEKIHVKNFEKVEKNSILISLSTSKANEDIISDHSGYIVLNIREKKEYEVNFNYANIFKSLDEAKIFFENISEKVVQMPKATKKAIQYANQFGVKLEDVKKTGLIKEKDILDFYEKQKLNKKNIDFIKKTIINKFKYDNERIIIVGGGTGCGVVYDILSDYNDKKIIGIVGEKIPDYITPDIPFLFNKNEELIINREKISFDSIIISLSLDMNLRKFLFNLFSENDFQFTNAIHKSACISKEVKIGVGNVIGAGVTIGYGSVIQNNNWIANKVNIDHHNHIGSHIKLGPNVSTSGKVVIEDNSIIGTGVFIEPAIKIGTDSFIKSGEIIIKDYNGVNNVLNKK